tara:strand:+ start:881 stop:1093 length:213 start_codon:yes stop_codon:yes gene_type:complete
MGQLTDGELIAIRQCIENASVIQEMVDERKHYSFMWKRVIALGRGAAIVIGGLLAAWALFRDAVKGVLGQ